MFAVGCIASLAGKVHGHPSRSSSRQDNRPPGAREARAWSCGSARGRRSHGGGARARRRSPPRWASCYRRRKLLALGPRPRARPQRAPWRWRSGSSRSRQSECSRSANRSFRQICTHRISPIISKYGRTQKPARSPTHTWPPRMTPCPGTPPAPRGGCVKPLSLVRAGGANRRRSAVRPDSLYGRLVPGTTCGGVRSIS